jgi:hypothetical protein
MTTYDYELLDPPADRIAAAIATTPTLARLLPNEVLDAMLGWSQMTQGLGTEGVYEACYEALHGNEAPLAGPLPANAPGGFDDPWGPCPADGPGSGILPNGWPEHEDLTAGTTSVRVWLLSCGHVQWQAGATTTEGVQFCLSCDKQVSAKHYLDEQAIDV